ncbi:MAG: flavodoxin family protein [Coprobacillus cateniformis]|nr:flavodoxin family protein [Coprobacillus cateniformis]
MKVLLINGSTHQHGCTYTALEEVSRALKEEGIETEIHWIGNQSYSDCIACGKCRETCECVFKDGVNILVNKAKDCDGFIFGTPVYYAHPSGRILDVLNRAFYSGSKYFAHKPGAAIASARRAGTIASIDVLNKYFTINQMPIVSSTYWNEIHGNTPQEALQDEEGMQTMYNLGKNMAWLLKCIEAGKEKGIQVPVNEKKHTNFIR